MAETVDDILGGLDFDGVDGSSRFPFITPGKYEFLLKKVFIMSGFKGGSFVANLEVLKSEKSGADDNPHPVGTMCSSIQKLGGTSKAAQVGPNNVVNFLSAATGFSSALFKSTKEDKDAGKKRIKQLIGETDGSMPEGPLVKLGVRVAGLCYRTKSDGGSDISPTAFSMVGGYTFKDLMAAAKNGQSTTQAGATA